MLAVAPALVKKCRPLSFPMLALERLRVLKALQQVKEHYSTFLHMPGLDWPLCGHCSILPRAICSTNGHIITPRHPDCPKSESPKVGWVNNVGPIASTLRQAFTITSDQCEDKFVKRDGTSLAGLVINDTCNNVAPFTGLIKKSVMDREKLCRKTKLQRGHSRIPSIVIDDTFAPKTFVFAVMIASAIPGDHVIDYRIRHGCSTAADAEKFATKRAYECVTKYAAMLDNEATNKAFHILGVEEDYPTPGSRALGDPHFLPSYTGQRPNEDTWAICKQLGGGGIEIYVRHWKHVSPLRWIKTVKFQVEDEWLKGHRPPRQVYLAQCRSELCTETTNVYPGRRENAVKIIGAYWSHQKASQACNSHIASLGIGDVVTVVKDDRVNMMYKGDGRRYKWCVKPYGWDGGIPGLV